MKKHPFKQRIAKYAESLLLDARRMGRISEAGVQTIRKSYHVLAAELAGDNLDATRVIRSVWYVVDAYLSAFDAKEALALLKNTSAKEIWESGLRVLRRLSYDVALLSLRTANSQLDLPNVAYNQVPRLARGFLAHYRLRTGAHKTSMQVDYTPVVPIPRQTGLYYLRLYLLFLYYENSFCRDCGVDIAKDCYGAYCFSQGEYDMEFLHVNVYKILFVQAIFTKYLNYEPGNYFMEEADISLAERLLSSLSPSEQKEALRQVVLRLPFGNTSYNLCALRTLFPTIRDAITHHRLSDLLPLKA